jgi:hypothetical protein
VKRLAVVGLLLVVSACGPITRHAAVSPSSSPHASVSVSGSPIASAPISTPALACRLPVAQQQPTSVRGGFVTFPSADLALDSSANFPSSPGATFTRRYNRWLPVGINAVSPDSSHYAYTEFIATPFRHARVHSVDVVSQSDRVVYTQTSQDHGFYVVLDYEAAGIYLGDVGPAGESVNGLWRLDPKTQSLQMLAPISGLASRHGYYLIGAGGAWYGDLAPGDAPPQLGIDPIDRLLRLDLTTGTRTPWFRRQGMEVEGLGFDGQGHPVIQAATMTADGSESTSQEIWLATAPGVAKQIYAGPGSNSSAFVSFMGPPLADDHGLWFGTSAGIYLYTADGNFQRVSAAPGQIAGRCS